MTCIVGIASKGAIYIGGDSAGVSGLDLSVRADRKVFTNGDFVMGFTTSFRMGQLLQFAFKPPKRHPTMDVMTFMVTDFIDALRACLKRGGFASRKDESESAGTFLVGYAGRLFRIDEDYQVGEAACGYAAVGCGSALALGALFVAQSAAVKPKDFESVVRVALHAAQAHSAGVRDPFHIVKGGAA